MEKTITYKQDNLHVGNNYDGVGSANKFAQRPQIDHFFPD